MNRPVKIMLWIVLTPVVLILLIAGSLLAYMFWPRHASVAKLTRAVSENMMDNGDAATALCGRSAVHLVHTDYKPGDFEKRYKSFANKDKSPFPKTRILTWNSRQDRGRGTAHVEGKGIDWDQKFVSPEICVGNVSFDYNCGWQDNGVSSRWGCVISNTHPIKK